MNRQTDFESNTLSWVKRELDLTLQEAVEALQSYSEEPEDRTQIQFCVTHLHQVRGILEMLEIAGGAMLTDEMEVLAQAVADGGVGNVEQASEALMRGILKLREYLEGVERGTRDTVLLILPLVNELRTARGAAIITESALFSPDLDVKGVAAREGHDGTDDRRKVAPAARGRFQRGLLDYLRGGKAAAGLDRMRAATDDLDRASPDEPTGRPWWVAGAFLDALRSDALADHAVTTRNLLAQVERRLRALAAGTDEAFDPSLLKALLYYIARAEAQTDRLREVHGLYRLDDLLADERRAEEARDGLFGPGAEAFAGVTEALLEDLAGVKDTLDLHARGSAGGAEALEATAEVMRRSAETLGMLGLTAPRRALIEQANRVDELAGGSAEDPERLVDRAADTLLYVESSLKTLGRDHAPDDSESPEDVLFESEYQGVHGAVVDEAVSEIGQIKEAIIRFLESHDVGHLAGLDGRFASVRGVMDLMGLERAAALIRAADRFITEQMRAEGELPTPAVLDDLADAITSIEYYLEAVRDGRRETEQVLTVAESSLARLGYAVTGTIADDAIETVEVHAPEEQPEESEFTDAEDGTTGISGDGADATSASVEPGEAAPRGIDFSRKRGRIDPSVPPRGDDLDEEIVEIFVEEAEEVLETLNAVFPRWRDNPEDSEALQTIRRMFHTLKGSGRMAGALLLGELAWSVENLLNRILERTLEPTSHISSLVDEAIEAVPTLVAALRDGNDDEAGARDLMIRAAQAAGEDVTAAGEPGDGVAGGEPADDAVPADESREQPADTEPDHVGPADEQPADTADTSLHGREEQAFTNTEEVSEGTPAIEPEPRADDPSLEVDDDEDPRPPAAPDTVDDEAAELEHLAGDDPEALEPDTPPDDGHGETADAVTAGDTPPTPVMDPVLYEIFRKETADHIATAERFLGVGVEHDEGARVSDELVRSLHTLTGSARMADVMSIARLGRAMEELARSRQNTGARLSETDRAMLRRGAERIHDVVDALADATIPPPDVDDLVAEANDLRMGPPAPSLEQLAWPDSTDDADADSSSLSEGERHESGPSTSPKPAVDASEGLDDELTGLFLEEAEDLLDAMEGALAAATESGDFLARAPELQRSLHTLKGGARLAGFEGIGRFCHGLETRLDAIVDAGEAPDDTFHELFADAVSATRRLVDAARAGHSPVPDADAERLLNEQPTSTQESGAPSTDGPDEAAFGNEGPDAAPNPDPAHEAVPPEPPASAVTDEPDTGDDAEPFEVADRELVEVFLEEATEVLAAAETALHDWRESPQETGNNAELQRALHTLKGGARMAGYSRIGDLAHHMETLLKQVEQGRVALSDDVFDLLERTNDRLVGQRDNAQRGERVAAADDLIEAIDRVERGGAAELPDHRPIDTEEPSRPPRDSGQASPPTVSRPEPSPDDPPPARDGAEEARRQSDVVRVRSDLLDDLVNYAGEVSIFRARLEQQTGSVNFNLGELTQTVTRLRDQLRTLEIETEAQILNRFEREREAVGDDSYSGDFDPLEMDRFSRMQELSRAISESVNDLASIQSTLDYLNRESETLLLQQSRVNADLQDGLMRTRMVPFANLVPRLRRVVRQAGQELGKKAKLSVSGAQGEMDRTVLERLVPTLEHMLRNAIAHGVEVPEQRVEAGKPEEGTITISFDRDGADVVIRVADDGSGMNLDAIRRKAVSRGLMRENAPLTDKEVMRFVLEAGFSTAETVTQIAGRGVGMDVVNAEIKQLGGNLDIDSSAGTGTRFTVRLPFTLALNQALLCRAGDEVYAIPLSSIEGVVRADSQTMAQIDDAGEDAWYEYRGERYVVRSLAAVLGMSDSGGAADGRDQRAPLVFVRAGDHRLALRVDGLIGSRDIVVKSVGAQISTVPGIFGATILADGRVVLILDVGSLVRFGVTGGAQADIEFDADDGSASEQGDRRSRSLVMVVDDSITMRKVATRLLERNDIDVLTAKDGVDALASLQDHTPDAMLLDIEMPRMDGYELATHMRNDERLKGVPIIMITSRTGEKHRRRALDIGVDRYLGKPYQESELMDTLRELLERRKGGD